MLVITDKGSHEFMDYSQLTHENGVWVIENYDLETKSVRGVQIDGNVLAIVNCP